MTQPPQQPSQFQMQPSVPGSGMGTASLVLGIIALVFLCLPPVAWLLGIVAIILGVISISQASGAPTGKAKAGIVLAGIAMVAGIAVFMAARAGAHKLGDVLQQKGQELQQKADEMQKKAQEESQRMQDQADQQMKKQQQPTPTQPGVMLTHPEGWSISIA